MPGPEARPHYSGASAIGADLRGVVLRPARRLAALLAGLHALVLVAIFASLAGWPLLIVSVASVLSLWRTVAEALLVYPRAVVDLRFRPDGSGEWTERRGRICTGRLGENAVVWPGLVVLSLREEGKSRVRWLVLDAGSAAPDALRSLRVWLRWRPAADHRPGELSSE